MTQGRGPGEKTKRPPLWGGAIDVFEWAVQRHTTITPQCIRERWGVSRATSFRWSPILEGLRERIQRRGIPHAPCGTRVPIMVLEGTHEIGPIRTTVEPEPAHP